MRRRRSSWQKREGETAVVLTDRQAVKKRAQRESKVTDEGDERPAFVLFLFLCVAKTRPPSGCHGILVAAATGKDLHFRPIHDGCAGR